MPNNGYLNFQDNGAAGLSSKFRQLSVRYRQGGENLSLPGRPGKSLKKLMQESAIPPWLRDRIPLLFHDNKLICVPGIGIAEEAIAAAGEPAYEVFWQPPDLEINLHQDSPAIFKAP